MIGTIMRIIYNIRYFEIKLLEFKFEMDFLDTRYSSLNGIRENYREFLLTKL